MYLKKSELKAIIDACCRDIYSNKPKREAALRQAVAIVLPKTCEYLDLTDFKGFAEEIANLAGKISYKIDPKIVKECLVEIWKKRETTRLRLLLC